MRLSVRPYIFYLTLVIACGYANAGSIAKRQSDDSSGLSGLVNTLIQYVGEIPLIGGDLAGILTWITNMIDVFEIGTNGALARLLGGALPCTITLDGTSCSGLTNNGGFGAVLLSTLDAVPSLLLPSFVKSILALLIEMFADPLADLLFGGVIVSA